MPPKPVYPARDLTVTYFKSNPAVPKFDPANFTRWKAEFVRYIRHLVQHAKFLEYKSIIEANPPGTEVDQCRGDELRVLVVAVGYQPRELVAQSADVFTKALTAASSKPADDNVPEWMLNILYDNLAATPRPMPCSLSIPMVQIMHGMHGSASIAGSRRPVVK